MRDAALGLLVAMSVVTVLVPGEACAAGEVRLSWDGCEPHVANKNPEDVGEDGIVTQVLSITGEARTNRGHLIHLRVGANVPDAWRFDKEGCPLTVNPNGIRASTKPADPSACASFKTGMEMPGWAVTYDVETGELGIELSQVYLEPFRPDSTRRYTLWQLHYDLGASLDPEAKEPCAGITERLCFHISRTPGLLIDADRPLADLAVSESFVTWNDPENEQACPNPAEKARKDKPLEDVKKFYD
jgi:hypothetical protein